MRQIALIPPPRGSLGAVAVALDPCFPIYGFPLFCARFCPITPCEVTESLRVERVLSFLFVAHVSARTLDVRGVGGSAPRVHGFAVFVLPRPVARDFALAVLRMVGRVVGPHPF